MELFEMRVLKACHVCIAALFILLAPHSHAQWTEPIRIAEHLRSPRIVAVGDTLHVVATSGTDIYYMRSNGMGGDWTDPVCPADTFYGSHMPDIAHSNGYLHLVCKLYFEEERNQIFHFLSIDGGRTWSEPTQLFENDSDWLKYPHIVALGDTLLATAVNGNSLLALVSFDRGESWNEESHVDYGGYYSLDHNPHILYANGRVHIIYQLGVPGDSTGIEIYHRYSDDYGETWSERNHISTPEHWQEGKYGQAPSACADSDGNIMALWFDYKYGSECGITGDILGRVSTDNGETWLSETRLTDTQTGSGSTCLVLDNKLYAIWMDHYPEGCFEPKLMYSESDDWGRSWSQPEVITGPAERIEYSPHLIYGTHTRDTTFHCAFWASLPDGSHDLFYFRSREPTGTCDADVISLPSGISLTAYPNPFNSSTMINFSNPEGDDTEIEIFNLLGQKIRSFTIEDVKRGQIVWDARDALGNKVSSGIYFAKAKTGNNYAAIKLLYMK